MRRFTTKKGLWLVKNLERYEAMIDGMRSAAMRNRLPNSRKMDRNQAVGENPTVCLDDGHKMAWVGLLGLCVWAWAFKVDIISTRESKWVCHCCLYNARCTFLLSASSSLAASEQFTRAWRDKYSPGPAVNHHSIWLEFVIEMGIRILVGEWWMVIEWWTSIEWEEVKIRQWWKVTWHTTWLLTWQYTFQTDSNLKTCITAVDGCKYMGR